MISSVQSQQVTPFASLTASSTSADSPVAGLELVAVGSGARRRVRPTVRKGAVGVVIAFALVMVALGSIVVAYGVSVTPPPLPDLPGGFTAQPDQPVTGPTDRPRPRPNPNTAGEPITDRLIIDAISVDAPVISTSTDDGQLGIPLDPTTVGQWDGGATANDKQGTTLIAGHVIYNTTKGALYHLGDLQPGNIAWVADHAGNLTAWKLVDLHAYVKAELPADIYSPTGPRRLVVVTCGGETYTSSGHRLFTENVVAVFVPVGS